MLYHYLWACALNLLIFQRDSVQAKSNLFSQLSSLRYRNVEDANTVHSGDIFEERTQPCGYLEPEKVTRAEYAWSQGNLDYLYLSNGDNSCNYTLTKGTDRPGDDYKQIIFQTIPTADHCGKACCNDTKCLSWVFAESAPSDFQSCKKGKNCCYLKNGVPAPKSAPYVSGTAQHAPAVPPPTGMRSSVPLGGIASGSIELRADGTLRAWTIVNQSPAGAAKFDVQDDAVFGLWTRDTKNVIQATLLRTHPPHGLPGVDSLRYYGSHPTSRLDVNWKSKLKASLYGYSTYKVNDMETSARPAIAFSLTLENPSDEAIDISFMFNLPLSVEQNTQRNGGKQLSVIATTSPAVCVQHCQATSSCMSWTLTSGKCILQSDIPFNAYLQDSFSGVKGTWKASDQKNCLTLRRNGKGPALGDLTLCAQADSSGSSISLGTGHTLTDLWKQFSVNGTFAGVSSTSAYGAIAVNATLPPSQNTVLTIVLGWYFPDRNYLSQNVGNYYRHLYKDSYDVATTMLQQLPTVLTDIDALHAPILSNSFPEWLQDTLINSLHHIRSAMWLADGRWRQWEAYDCVNMDSIHNDGERHIQYIMIFPNSTRSKLTGWGNAQGKNGMLPEQLACGCTGGIDSNFEHGCGRIMSDVSSMFLVYLLELYRWQGDRNIVNDTWARAKKAAQWHIDVSSEFGLPKKLQTTYDILGLNRYDVSAYSSFFHLLAMAVSKELAQIVGDTDFANECQTALQRGQTALDKLLWNQVGYWNAYSGGEALMADSLYGQVLAYTLGLGPLVEGSIGLQKMNSQLKVEEEENETPFGLQIMTGRTLRDRKRLLLNGLVTRRGEFTEQQVQSTEKSIWMMSSANHATLMLRNGQAYQEAIKIAEKPYKQMRSVLRDMWNTPGLLYGQEGNFPGQPYITSHYGYHTVVWHTAIAISGQVANLAKGSLLFKSALTLPYSLPVLLPGVLGHISSLSTNGISHFVLNLTAGQLTLQQLSCDNSPHPGPFPLTITPNRPATW